MARDLWEDRSPDGYFDRAAILWTNAHKLLRGIRAPDGLLRRPKRVREASGAGWLAVEEAIKGLARRKGVSLDKLLKEIDQLGQTIAQDPRMEGKLHGDLHEAWHSLHVGGNYNGVRSKKEILDGLEAARRIVQRATGKSLPLRRA